MLTSKVNSLSKKDDGAALALVLVMIVILGLWITSVAFLTQSSNSSIRTNIENSNYRSKIVSNGIAQVLAAITVGDNRYGVRPSPSPRPNFGISEFPCEDAPSSSSGVFISEIDPDVQITCTQSTTSGLSAALASYIATGTTCKTGETCVVGRDFGIKITNNSATENDCYPDPLKTSSPTGRLIVEGGILNASGAWSGVNCGTLLLSTADRDNPSQILQPIADGACPAQTLLGQKCQCPIVSNNLYLEDCKSGIAAKDLDIRFNNEFRSYMESEASKTSPLANSSKFATYTPKQDTCPSPAPGEAAFTWSPGIIGSEQLSALNAQTGTGSRACGAGKPIHFLPGVYRFDVKCGDRLTTECAFWKVLKADQKIVAGVPNSDFSNCLFDSPGVQFQFKYPAGLEIATGAFSICNNSAPVFSAPLQGFPADFSWAEKESCPSQNQSMFSGSCDWTLNEILKIPQSNGNLQVNFNGLVYAPAGFTKINLNQPPGGIPPEVNFRGGAIFRAIDITASGNFKSGFSVSPPPPFNGDRVIQLHFYDRSAPAGTQKDLGVVQVVIRDFYGRRLASSYQILSWRASW